jgi:predicted hydrocarbon binding protein
MPKSYSKVKDMKKLAKVLPVFYEKERSGILEYLEDASKTDEHYIRVHENFNCWGFKDVGAPMASYLPAMIAGQCKAFEYWKSLDREWNAVETKCIGLGDPYCEIKLVPGPISELEDSLEKDISVIGKIHDNLMHRLMGFLIEGKPLVTRPKLGSDVYVHPVWHTMGGENIPAMDSVWSERYKMALRLGGAKAGKEVGEHLIEAGVREDEAVKRLFYLLEYCKAGKISVDETIVMKENCENVLAKLYPMKLEEVSCFFTTGFLNGFFSAVKNQHVKETQCIAMGDPYCEWEFR